MLKAKAMMSDRAGRGVEPQDWRAVAWTGVPADALREALMILAETERPEHKSFGHAAFHVSLTLLNRDYLDDGAADAVALAESLAAVLPVLDEMEREARQ